MDFWTHGPQKTLFVKCLKSHVSEDSSTSHMVNGPAETLFKPKRQHLYHIYINLCKQFKFKRSLWLICKIFGLFVNPFTVENKYSLLNRGNLLQHFQRLLSQKWQTTFLDFFFNFLDLDSPLGILKKKMTLLAHVLLNFQTPKSLVR